MASTTTANTDSHPSSSSSSSLAFQDDFTHSHGGGCFFVAVEPVFDEQISQLATVIARSSPSTSTEAQRTDYIHQYTTQAQHTSPSKPVTEDDAAPPDDEDADASTSVGAAPLTAEQRSQRRALLEKLLNDLNEVRIQALDREFQGFAHLFLALLLATYEVTDHAFAKAVLKLVDALAYSQGKIAHPTLSTRYATLANVFNALPTEDKAVDALRLAVVEKLVNAAAQNDDYLVIEPVVKSLEAWLVQWGFAGENASTEARQKGDEAVLKIVGLLNQAQDVVPRLAQIEKDLLVAHLSNASEESWETQKKLASHLIALVLRLPNEYDFSALASLPALKQPSSHVLAQLLDVFVQPGSSVHDLDRILSSGSEDELKAFELDPAALRNKLRLLALTELCSSRVGHPVPYDEIAQALHVVEAEHDQGESVENWVIDAIRAGLVSGRLQGSEKTFMVTKASPRVFAEAEWNALEKRLREWRGSLDGILESVKRGLGGGNAGHGSGAQDVLKGAAGAREGNEKEMIAV
ncbi:BQ2448_3845 [Microbotryum intermedium]|uniref:Eukaryotic translation initiation factor 3 subunit M n=1 Tax=Microbotryum intermedium TaxID=269621 RepID=A0A238FM93_9BASI|nr:BQ2448_3845 [Microbotryum intermedium]